MWLQKEAAATWNTAAGMGSMNEKCNILISLPDFSPSKVIEWKMHIGTLENITYDMIIGNDLLEYLETVIKYSTLTIVWNDTEIPMKLWDATIYDTYHIQDTTPCLEEAAECIKGILDAKYETANCTHLT